MGFRKLLQSTAIAALLLASGFILGMTVLNSEAEQTPVNDGEVFSLRTAFEQPARAVTTNTVENPVTIQQDEMLDVMLSETDLTRAELYEQVAPSVVAISVVRTNVGFGGEDVGGSGSGFVIDTAGHIVTNYHVVQDAEDIIVRFFDGTIIRADTVGLDPDSDIAVLRVDLPEDRLIPVTFGDIEPLRIGQSVVALGSPFGQDWTLTSGIISAKNRSIRGLGDYSIGSAIQTDTPINPGNSGGPLLNLQGEVIGVNSQILSEQRANSGVGFAVPADLVARVADELINEGQVNYSYIGISGVDIDLTIMEALDLANNQRGVAVCTIEEGSPASNSDLEPDDNACGRFGPYQGSDVIIGIDGRVVDNFAQLISYLARNTRPGDTVTFEVLRDGERVEVDVTLGNRRDF